MNGTESECNAAILAPRRKEAGFILTANCTTAAASKHSSRLPMTRRALLLAPFLSRHGGMVRIPGGTFRMGSDEKSLQEQFPNAGRGLKAMLLTETPASEV